MSYYLVYSKLTNHLVYLDEYPPSIPLPDSDYVTQERQGDIPRLDINAWNPSILDFYAKNVVKLTKLEFMSRFTAQERIAFKAAVKTDPIAADIDDQFSIAEWIDPSDSRVLQGIQYLASVGVIAPDRVQSITGV